MFSMRFRLTTTRITFLRNYSSKIPGDIDKSPELKENAQEDSVHKKNDATERINELLQSMMKYKSKAQTVESLVDENTGFRRSKLVNNHRKDSVEDIKNAAAAVAHSLGENAVQTEEELLSKALEHKKFTENVNWSNLIDGMAIDKSTSEGETIGDKSRSYQVRNALSNSRGRNVSEEVKSSQAPSSKIYSQCSAIKMPMKKFPLFNSPPLDIFKNNLQKNEGTELRMWDSLEKNEMRYATTQPPANYFQKMILWTNQGKVWKFPIDNEQGMEAEQSVHFTEHIFLENHLEGWCPHKGPIRHFMELVCVGLSKNHYYTAKEKRDHIEWFKNYFESKKTLLQEVGAIKMEHETKQLSS